MEGCTFNGCVETFFFHFAFRQRYVFHNPEPSPPYICIPAAKKQKVNTQEYIQTLELPTPFPFVFLFLSTYRECNSKRNVSRKLFWGDLGKS